MRNLKRDDTNKLTEQKETHRLGEQTYGCWGGERRMREFGMDMRTQLYLKRITNKNRLNSA